MIFSKEIKQVEEEEEEKFREQREREKLRRGQRRRRDGEYLNLNFLEWFELLLHWAIYTAYSEV